MGFLRFWGKCFRQSIRRSFELADFIAFAAPPFIAAAAYLLGIEIVVATPWWRSTLILLALVFLSRLLFVAPYQVWREAAKSQARLHSIEQAMSHSDRELIPIREAMDMIIRNLRDTWPANLTHEKLKEKAAAKLREIGWHNRFPIYGFRAIETPDIFTDHRVAIPPEFWNKNHIVPDYVYGRESTPDEPIPHTEEDEEFAEEIEYQPIYGDLRINRVLLETACPPPAAG